jgi:hypothetical protein
VVVPKVLAGNRPDQEEDRRNTGGIPAEWVSRVAQVSGWRPDEWPERCRRPLIRSTTSTVASSRRATAPGSGPPSSLGGSGRPTRGGERRRRLTDSGAVRVHAEAEPCALGDTMCAIVRSARARATQLIPDLARELPQVTE